MDLFGWFWLVVFFTRWFGVSADGMGRKFLSDLHEASPVLLETVFWNIVLYVWVICAIITILAVSMARSKNIGKGKAPSSSMERAVKKRKSNSSQPVKKGKGKQIESSPESEEVSESDDDDEIEAMFAEGSESEQEKWAQSIANKGFHCERGVKLETFLYSYPIRGVIQDQNMQFVCTEVQGYLPTVVREFYINMKENQRAKTLLETTMMGKQIRITPDSIAQSLLYVRPSASDRPYPLRAISDFDAQLFAEAMCTRPVTMSGFVRKEFVPGKLKLEYALMNKIIHDKIGPQGNEKSPSREQIQFLYEVMTEKLIDYALVIWCVMRDFLQFSHESRHISFPSLVTSLVEAVGMQGVAKEKKVLPRLGPITKKNGGQEPSRIYETPAFTASSGYSRGPFIYNTSTYEHIPIEENGVSNKRVVQVHFGETEAA